MYVARRQEIVAHLQIIETVDLWSFASSKDQRHPWIMVFGTEIQVYGICVYWQRLYSARVQAAHWGIANLHFTTSNTSGMIRFGLSDYHIERFVYQ